MQKYTYIQIICTLAIASSSTLLVGIGSTALFSGAAMQLQAECSTNADCKRGLVCRAREEGVDKQCLRPLKRVRRKLKEDAKTQDSGKQKRTSDYAGGLQNISRKKWVDRVVQRVQTGSAATTKRTSTYDAGRQNISRQKWVDRVIQRRTTTGTHLKIPEKKTVRAMKARAAWKRRVNENVRLSTSGSTAASTKRTYKAGGKYSGDTKPQWSKRWAKHKLRVTGTGSAANVKRTTKTGYQGGSTTGTHTKRRLKYRVGTGTLKIIGD